MKENYKEIITGEYLQATIYVKEWPGGSAGLRFKAELRESLNAITIWTAAISLRNYIDSNSAWFTGRTINFYVNYRAIDNIIYIYYSTQRQEILTAVITTRMPI